MWISQEPGQKRDSGVGLSRSLPPSPQDAIRDVAAADRPPQGLDVGARVAKCCRASADPPGRSIVNREDNHFVVAISPAGGFCAAPAGN